MAKRINGDTFILCQFNFHRAEPFIFESSNSLGDLCAKIPDWIGAENHLAVCRVGYWIANSGDPTDAIPKNITTIFQVEEYNAEAAEEDWESDAISC